MCFCWLSFPSSDVKDVGYVIVRPLCFVFLTLTLTVSARMLQNYDFPNNCEDYIHRIGRTGVGIFVPCTSLRQYPLHFPPPFFLACGYEGYLLHLLYH
jgi:hypothetical protein